MNGILDDFKGAFSKPNNGLIQIILINVFVFLLMIVLRVVLSLAESPETYLMIKQQLIIPPRIGDFIYRPWTLFTYFFLHEEIFHILFNMLFLYWFGKLVDEYLGNRRLINLYIMGGLAGGILYLLMYNLIPYYQLRSGFAGMLGASGAVYAVVVGAATLMPNYTFFMFLLGPVRIKYIAAFFLILSFASSVGANAGGNLAHLGGALLGFVFIRQLKRGNDLGKPLTNLSEGFKGMFRRKPKMKVTYNKRTGNPAVGGQPYSAPNQDEIDAILDKISKSGYESLTKEEKQKLFRASQKN
jgi:membrane associated rhomboid family serine protease